MADKTSTFHLRYKTYAEDIQRAKAANQSIVDLAAKAEQAIFKEGGTAKDVAAKMAALHTALTDASQAENRMAAAADAATTVTRRQTYGIDEQISAERSSVNAKEDVVRSQERVNSATREGASVLDNYVRALKSAEQSSRQQSVLSIAQGGASGGGGSGGGLRQIDRFGRVGGQILGGLGASQAANAVNLIGDVAGSFTLLNPAMLAVTAAGVGLAAVFGDIQRGIEAAKQAGQEFAQRQLTNQQLIESGATTADVEGLRDDAAARFERFGARYNSLTDIRNQLIEATAGVPSFANVSPTGLGSEGDRADQLLQRFQDITGITVVSLDQMNAALAGTAQNVTDAGNEQLNYQQLLNSGALAVNDMAAANEQLGDVLGILGGAVTNIADAFNEAKQEAFDAAQALSEYNSVKLKEIQLAREAAAFAAAELRAQGISDITDELFEANEKVNETYEKQRLIVEDLNAAQGKLADNLAEIEANAEQERTKNVEDAGKRRNKIVADSEERILDITRKAGLQVLNAIGARDALAAFNAAQQAKEQVNDEKKAQRKRLDELRDSLNEQNRLVDDRLRQRIRLEQIRGAEEINNLRRAHQAAEVERIDALNAQRLIQRQANIALGQEAYLGGKSAVAFFKAGIQDGLRTGGGGKGVGAQQSYFYTAPQFSGSLAPSPFQFTNQSGGSNQPVVFAPTITGQTRQQTQKQINQGTEAFLDRVYGPGFSGTR